MKIHCLDVMEIRKKLIMSYRLITLMYLASVYAALSDCASHPDVDPKASGLHQIILLIKRQG